MSLDGLGAEALLEEEIASPKPASKKDDLKSMKFRARHHQSLIKAQTNQYW